MIPSTRAVWIALIAVLAVLIFMLGPWGTGDPVADSPNGGDPTQLENANPEAVKNAELDQGTSGVVKDQRTTDPPTDEFATLKVVNADGAPMTKCWLVVFQGDEVLAQASTNDEGLAVFKPLEGEHSLAISSQRRPPHLQQVTLSAGQQTIVFPDGARVTGRIRLVDGKPAQELRLRLTSKVAVFDFSSLPESVIAVLGVYPDYPMYWVTTNAAGEFSFDGLPQTWSGALSLRDDFEFVAVSHGKLQPNSRFLDLSAPESALELSVVQPIKLHGKLVAEGDQSPIANTGISVKYTSVGDSKLSYQGAETKADGTFRLDLTPAEVESLDLRLGSGLGVEFHNTQPVLQLEREQIPADGNLGTLVVSGLRRLAFELRDPQGRPISGGRGKAGGIKSPPTDSDGAAEFTTLPAEVAKVRFLASGFIPKEVQLEKPIPSFLTVHMERGNRLDIEIKPPAGLEVTQFRAKLGGGGEYILAGPADNPAQLGDYLQYMSFLSYQMKTSDVGTVLLAEPDGAGKVQFSSLRSDLPLHLEIIGITGNTVFHAQELTPLGAQEQRKLTVDLTDAGLHFHGRVLGPNDDPVVFATIQLGGEILDHTDGSGMFSALVVEKEPRTLVVGARGYATLFQNNYQVPRDQSSVEIRLQKSMPVKIYVVDQAGNPVPDAQVRILREKFTTTTTDLGNGVFEAGGLSADKVGLRVQVAGRSYTQDLYPAQGEARVVVPMHGGVQVELDPPTESRAGTYRIVLVAEVDGEILVHTREIPATGKLSATIPFVYPGTYEAELTYRPNDTEIAAGMVDTVIGEAVEVEVIAEQTVVLRMPAD